eukprot:scaffold300970_cov18-Tisochrysis_lutea.AAC.1
MHRLLGYRVLRHRGRNGTHLRSTVYAPTHLLFPRARSQGICGTTAGDEAHMTRSRCSPVLAALLWKCAVQRRCNKQQ